MKIQDIYSITTTLSAFWAFDCVMHVVCVRYPYVRSLQFIPIERKIETSTNIDQTEI